MNAYLENLCGKMRDARKRDIPKSKLAGSTSLQAAVLGWLASYLFSRYPSWLSRAGLFFSATYSAKVRPFSFCLIGRFLLAVKIFPRLALRHPAQNFHGPPRAQGYVAV